jgi:hypothetical protein
MAGTHVEYVGFTNAPDARDYRLRVQDGGVFHDFVLSIPLEAFRTRRARYQDAPEICFLKLQRALAECVGTLPDARLIISDIELEEYRTAHAPKAVKPRPKPEGGVAGHRLRGPGSFDPPNP